MKKLTLSLFLFLTLSCGQPIKENEPEVISNVNLMIVDTEWSVQGYKYVVRTKKLTLVTNTLYNIGDTLKIGK